MPKHKRQKIADETLDIYAPLATMLGLFAIKRELYNLALRNKFPRKAKALTQKIARLRRDPAAAAIVARVEEALDRQGIKARVVLRTKGLWGYYDVRNRILVNEIESPQEILIVTEGRSDCYAALGAVNQCYPPIPRTIRDFIANPKPTGYQGLHARANIDGIKYLFKIRTEEMGRQARQGLVAGWTQSGKSSRAVRELQEIFAILGSEESVSYRDMIAAGGRKEIYTYTPRGDLFWLPVNSIVLDFAFRVHTEIGLTCVGAVISGRTVGPTEVLRDGDVVFVLCQEEPVVFDADVQKRCQTPRARSELAKTFRKRRQEVSRIIGRSILAQELRRYGMPFDVLEKPGMEDILAYFDLASMDELYQRLGEGRLRMRELIYEIRSGLYVGKEVLQVPVGVFNRVDLATIDPVVIKSSACCRPTPLDKGVIGLLSERGLSLHRKDCATLPKIRFQREDAVEVRWQWRKTPVPKRQKVVVMAASRSQLLSLLAGAPAEMEIEDIYLLSRKATERPAWEITFRVANLYGLKRALKHLSRAGVPYEFILEQ